MEALRVLQSFSAITSPQQQPINTEADQQQQQPSGKPTQVFCFRFVFRFNDSTMLFFQGFSNHKRHSTNAIISRTLSLSYSHSQNHSQNLKIIVVGSERAVTRTTIAERATRRTARSCIATLVVDRRQRSSAVKRNK